MTNMTLHFNGLGSNARVFEALSSMLSRNALNPADVSAVRERGERERACVLCGEREGGMRIDFFNNNKFFFLAVLLLC